MPNAAEIIRELTAELEIYKLFAKARGFKNYEAVMIDVEAQLDRSLAEESQPQ